VRRAVDVGRPAAGAAYAPVQLVEGCGSDGDEWIGAMPGVQLTTADMTSISGESTVEGQSGLLMTGSRTRSPDQQVM
jgi:hypothetical protein